MPTDRFTAEWYRLQFEGLCHTVNMLAAKQAADEQRFAAAWARIEALEADNREMAAKLGEHTDRLDRAAAYVKDRICPHVDGERPCKGNGKAVPNDATKTPTTEPSTTRATNAGDAAGRKASGRGSGTPTSAPKGTT